MKPYSATPALRMTPLAERAVAKLDVWLREDKARVFSDAVDQLRDGVDHLATCSGMEGKCSDSDCEDRGYDPRLPTGPDNRECDRIGHRNPCEECHYYRDGDTYQRPLADLLEEVEAREAALFEVA